QRLLDYLLPHFPDFDSESLDREKVFRALYPEGKWVKGKLEKRMTSLLYWIQRFICWDRWDQRAHPIERELLLADFYEERGSERLSEWSMRRMQKLLKSDSIRDKSYYLRAFRVQNKIAEYQSLNHNTRKRQLDFPHPQESLEVLYLIHKLTYYCALLSIKGYPMAPDTQAELDRLEALGENPTERPHLHLPLLRAYALALIFLRHRDREDAYRQLQGVLEKHDNQFSLRDRQSLRAFCRNFSIYHSNQGRLDYQAETFRIYQADLQRGLLYYHNGLTVSTLRNIVTSGLLQKQFDWVRKFLEEHRSRIVGALRPEEIYHFNLARYHFALGEHAVALDLIADHYDDLYYQIAARRLEIMIHYETDSPLLDAKLDAFKTFLYRLSKKQISEHQRRGNQHFFNALRQILHPQTPFDDQRVRRLIEKWQGQSVLVEKDWLLEKLRDLT
ncbi:MAG: hypothetical protein AAFR05_06445, partial [Bacteroidota bacterium]